MDGLSGEGRSIDGSGDVPSLRSRSCALDDVSFGALLDVDAGPRVQWATPDGFEVAGRGVAARIEADGEDRFERVRTGLERAFAGLDHDGPRAARPRAFGGFSFHAGYRPGDPWRGFAAASFAIPRVQAVRTDEGTWLTVVGDRDAVDDDLARWRERVAGLPAMRPVGPKPGVEGVRRTTSRGEWTRQVETVLDRIDAGDAKKVTLAQALSADLERPIDVPSTVERLRRRYPNCYRFLCDRDGATFFGAPPERLVSKRGERLETEALAGSAPRGETPREDDAFADRLRESEKIRREHGFVVDAIRDQLSALADEVRVADRRLRAIATIQHLRTPIEADLPADRHVLEVVEALHPTPAVGGLPPGAAGETIRSVETFDRGWYAAPVGWVDGDGDGEFAVAIRSGVALEGTVTLYAGNGIVADSDPDEEWEEVRLKYRPVLDELR